ncbi:MAG: hypothetical protein COS88_02305 [Chloroflexi bacterium CG07_land_8_20_14_0_80_51_10]|nr:MAG: hypothetical protein COS88_02305 [Chloroflexi bacterium CG07_land_8_20_14_0_80_51_10]
MEIKYAKDIDILNIELEPGNFEYSEELAEGIILDIGHDGEILSIEIFDVSKRLEEEVTQKIAQKYLAPA